MSSLAWPPLLLQPLATSPDPVFTITPPGPRPPCSLLIISPYFFLSALNQLEWLQWRIPARSKMRHPYLHLESGRHGSGLRACSKHPGSEGGRRWEEFVDARLSREPPYLWRLRRTEAHASNVGRPGFAITRQCTANQL